MTILSRSTNDKIGCCWVGLPQAIQWRSWLLPTCSVVEFWNVANKSVKKKKPPGELYFLYYVSDGCGRLSHPHTQYSINGWVSITAFKTSCFHIPSHSKYQINKPNFNQQAVRFSATNIVLTS